MSFDTPSFRFVEPLSLWRTMRWRLFRVTTAHARLAIAAPASGCVLWVATYKRLYIYRYSVRRQLPTERRAVGGTTGANGKDSCFSKANCLILAHFRFFAAEKTRKNGSFP